MALRVGLDGVGFQNTSSFLKKICFAFSGGDFHFPRRTPVSSFKTMLLSVQRRVVGMKRAVPRGSAWFWFEVGFSFRIKVVGGFGAVRFG